MVDEYRRWRAGQAEPWAESVRRAKLHADGIAAEIATLESMCDGIGAVRYDKDGGSGYMAHGDDRTAAYAIKRDELTFRLGRERDEWLDMVSEFETCCSALDGRYGALLRLRYVCDFKWDDVAMEVKHDADYVRGPLKEAALAALYDVMPHRFRAPMEPAI